MWWRAGREYEVRTLLVRALDPSHPPADHEQTLRPDRAPRGSSCANPFACIASGLACLLGPRTRRQRAAAAGAIRLQTTLRRRSASSVKNVKDRTRREADGLRHLRLQDYDPAAKPCRRHAEGFGGCHERPLLELAKRWKGRARDEYSSRAALIPNVTSIRASAERALGIPTRCSPASIASPAVGWIAQWNRVISDPEQQSCGRPALPGPSYATSADRQEELEGRQMASAMKELEAPSSLTAPLAVRGNFTRATSVRPPRGRCMARYVRRVAGRRRKDVAHSPSGRLRRQRASPVRRGGGPARARPRRSRCCSTSARTACSARVIRSSIR